MIISDINPYSLPFLLAAYGLSNKFETVDVLHRWLWIFEKSRELNARVVAYSTDCDSRQLLSVRLATEFFAKYNNIVICNRVDVLEIDLPQEWKTCFFYADSANLFLFSRSSSSVYETS
jgi:Icc-related predicted phosphoesterase